MNNFIEICPNCGKTFYQPIDKCCYCGSSFDLASYNRICAIPAQYARSDEMAEMLISYGATADIYQTVNDNKK